MKTFLILSCIVAFIAAFSETGKHIKYKPSDLHYWSAIYWYLFGSVCLFFSLC